MQTRDPAEDNVPASWTEILGLVKQQKGGWGNPNVAFEYWAQVRNAALAGDLVCLDEVTVPTLPTANADPDPRIQPPAGSLSPAHPTGVQGGRPSLWI